LASLLWKNSVSLSVLWLATSQSPNAISYSCLMF
jgi:hypothetical protein